MQVNLSRGGLPKRPVFIGKLTRTGFETDSFAHPQLHGGPSQAVLLVANEAIEELAGLGYPVYAGALGENLTTSGLNPQQWRAGQQFRVGSSRIELTKLRVPCRALDSYRSPSSNVGIRAMLFDSAVKRGDVSAALWGRSGFYARVLQEGEIASGDTIVLESELA